MMPSGRNDFGNLFDGMDDGRALQSDDDFPSTSRTYSELRPVSLENATASSVEDGFRSAYTAEESEIPISEFPAQIEASTSDDDYAAYYYNVHDVHQELIDQTLRDLEDAEERHKNVNRLLEEELLTVSQAEHVLLEKDKARLAMQQFLTENRKKEMFACFVCGRAYYDENEMRRHINKEHLSQKETHNLKCPKCHLCFKHRQHMNRHVKLVHSENTGFPCTHCKAKFATNESLSVHKSRVHNLDEEDEQIEEKELNCEHCQQSFGLEVELKRHEYYCKRKDEILEQRAKRKQELMEEASRSCSSRSVSPVILALSPSGRPKLDKSCPFCRMICASMQSRNRHIKRAHPEKKDDPLVSTKQYIKVESPYLPFGCTTCGKRFSSQASLGTHKKRVHENDTPFGCDLCDKRFPLASELRKHIIRSHKDGESRPDGRKKIARIDEESVDDLLTF